MNSNLLLRWLEAGTGVVAQAIRVKLAELGLSITCSDDADAILNLLHERELHDHTSCRADGLALKKLASVVETVLGHDDACPLLVRDELVAFVESLGIELTDAGCPHSDAPQGGGDPLTAAAETLAAKLAGASSADIFEGDAARAAAGSGTSSAPFEMPRRSKVPISEFKTEGYMTLAFPTLFPNGEGAFEEDRDYPIKWEVWVKHLMHYYDGRFATVDC